MRQTHQLSHEQVGEARVIRATGKFDREAGLAVEALITSRTTLHVLNLAKVDYISSSGVAELVRLATRFGVKLASPAQCVQDVLHLAGIASLVTIHADERAALDAR